MNKLIISVLLCLFTALTYAEVQAQVEASQVELDEPFRLTLTQNNLQNGNNTPDLTPLRKDFIVLGTENSVNYSLINGQAQSSSTWVITLKAQKAGTLNIPPIKIGGEQTQPISITVSTNAPQQKMPDTFGNQQQQALMITTGVSSNKPYVNQQIIYKVTFYNSKQLLDANYQPPQVKNALLIPLGGERRYQTQKNNTSYLVEEQNYAIFPQKSGPLKITSPVLTALVYDFNPQRVKAKDKDTNLNVQPIPKQYTGKEWLPAKQVKLTEEYEDAGQSIAQGSTLVRTVTLEGVGIPAQLLPSLHFADSDAFNVYPEKGKENNQIIQGELIGTTQVKVTYLFNKSGNITIPELKLPWFNTETGKEEVATLAAKTITITPSTTAQKTPALEKSQPIITNTTENTATTPQEVPTPQTVTKPNYWPWAIAALFAIAWVITLILWAWQKRRPVTEKNSYKKALKELHTACIQNNPQRARDALLKWGSSRWPDAPMLNLTDLSHLIHDAQLKKQIQILSQALYQDAEKHLWHGDELWRSVQNEKSNNAKKNNPNNVLPPMNPL